MTDLSICVLGPFEVILKEEPVTRFRSAKDRALLAYLAVEADRTHTRETLAALLWPDVPNAVALSSLRRVLSNLRRAIGDREATYPCLLITRQTVTFDTGASVEIDARRFAELASASGDASSDLEKLQETIALYRGDLLEGFSLADSAPFEEWLVVVRERFRRQLLSALRRLAERLERTGDYERARSYAWRLAELQPWDEAAHQTLMRTLALSGRRAEALAQYVTCRRLLDRELGVEPSQETKALYERIRDGLLTRAIPILPMEPQAALTFPGDALDARARSPRLFVARREELSRLESLLQGTLEGDGQVAFVIGEPGSGKTMLVREFLRRALALQPDLVVATGRCNAHTGLGDPYLPFLEILGLLTGDVEPLLAAGDISREGADRLWRMIPDAVQALLAHGEDLVDLFVAGSALSQRAATHAPGGEPWRAALGALLGRRAAADQRNPDQVAIFAQYTRVLQALATRTPLVLFIDDLQWGDPGSISLLFHLGRRLPGSRILLVGAYRPGEVALGRGGARHPLAPVVNELRSTYGDLEIDLSRADGRQLVTELLEHPPNRFEDTFAETLWRHTGGHPLFSVELLRAFQERGDLVRDEDGLWVEGAKVDWRVLPARVEAVIAERIGRLSEDQQSLLTTACIEGEAFTAEAVAKVQGRPTEEVIAELSRGLGGHDPLAAASRVDRVGGLRLSRYRFRHYLFWAYLDGRLDGVERSRLHALVGEALETLYSGDEEIRSEMALQLARHFEGARLIDKAVHYLQQAADRAMRLFASEEALTHYQDALALLQELPDTPDRSKWELHLQLALINPLMTARGYAAEEVLLASTRAHELALEAGDDSGLFSALVGLGSFHSVRAHHHEARRLAGECLSLAQRLEDPTLLSAAHFAVGFNLEAPGELRSAVSHLRQALALSDPETRWFLIHVLGYDVDATARVVLSRILWQLGYPDQALEGMAKGLDRAWEQGHPHTIAMAYALAASTCNAWSEPHRALELARTAVEVSIEHDIPHYKSMALLHKGWAMTRLGGATEGLALMHEGYASFPTERRRADQMKLLWWFADAYAETGDIERALDYLRAAQAEREAVGAPDGYINIQLMSGDLLLRQSSEHSPEAEAEACFHEAIVASKRIGAKSWELRATIRLCRLWETQGRRQEARETLSAIYGWFTEGFGTPDLVDARALLGELAA